MFFSKCLSFVPKVVFVSATLTHKLIIKDMSSQRGVKRVDN
jgi:hypothetical protein